MSEEPKLYQPTPSERQALDSIFPARNADTLTIACGHTSPDMDTERRVRVMRGEENYPMGKGCGGMLHWTYAYRCLQCGRFMHADCLREHFGWSKHHEEATS